MRNPSIGVLLCRNKDDEVVEYAMNRHLSSALLTQYETQMIPESHTATEASRMQPAATQIVSSESI